MAVDLAKYVVSLEAETMKYTQQLQQANNKLEQFQQRNTAALKRLDDGFFNMGNRFTLVAGKLRAVFGLFGVAFGVRALSGWIKDAIQIEKLTDDQAKSIGAASAAMKELTSSVGDLAREVSTRLAPGIEHAAKWWREFLFPTEIESADARIEEMSEKALQMSRTLVDLVESGALPADAPGVTRVRQEIEALQKAMGQAIQTRDELAGAMNQAGPDRSLKTFIAQMEFEDKLRQEQAKAIAAGQRLSPELEVFIDRLQDGEKITASMRTEVEEQVAAWREAKQLFDEGIISAETLNRLDEAQLRPIEVTAERMKETMEDMSDAGKDAAISMGQSFKSAFDGWLIDGERGFKDLLKRMAVSMTTSALFKGMAGLFPGGSFFSNFFGGFMAEGGPLSPGKWYIAGEHGPEPVWGGGSGAFAAGYGGGGGSSVSIVNNIDARGADQGLLSRLPAVLAANNKQLKAEIKDLMGRGRF